MQIFNHEDHDTVACLTILLDPRNGFQSHLCEIAVCHCSYIIPIRRHDFLKAFMKVNKEFAYEFNSS
jgi:hypothetical protein